MKTWVIICATSLVFAAVINVPVVSAAPTSRIAAKSALSKCLAKAKKKKGAFARNKAIRACLNRRFIYK